MAHWNRMAAATAFAAAFSLAATPVLARSHHRWHHHGGVDGGDMLAGALIVGGIAAIASAAKKSRAADDAPAPPPVPDDQGYSARGDQRGPGLDHAAGLCADAIERGTHRVDTIGAVIRDRDGMSVEGTLANGDGFDCRIGRDGQVLAVNFGGPASESRNDDDDAPPETDNRPVWHGDDTDQQEPPSQGDGRYSTSHAPDSDGGG